MVALIERRHRGLAVTPHAAWLWVLLFALLLPGRADAAPTNPCNPSLVTNFLAADATHPGLISLYFFGARGAPVTYYECVRGKPERLGRLASEVSGTPTLLSDATTWSCDRLTRRFVATAPKDDGTLAVGTYSVRTMSCAGRFQISVPRRVATGQLLRIKVSDTWGIGGIRPLLCITSPTGSRSCDRIAFAKAVAVASRKFRADVRGRLLVEVRHRDRRVKSTTVAVGIAGVRVRELPTVLATGDSMMQGVDSYLADELADRATVRSDVRPGTAIGKGLEWLKWSTQQVTRYHPYATVLAIGPNEGWPQQTPEGVTVECCGEEWEDEYVRRVRVMMHTYRRRGAGRVVWLTLPAPKGDRLTAIFQAVNRSILRAGENMPRTTIVRSDLIFSPDGFRETMRYNGVTVDVREPDGVHLNAAGTAIAAKEIARVLR
jgi:lysophospholipase L1-like esterase